MKQDRIDSLMETVTNTVMGAIISLVVWHVTAAAYHIPMPVTRNLQITGIFTLTSLVRQFALRRAFNGRTVWQSIKERLTPVTPQ